MPGFENYNLSGMWYQDEQDQYILAVYMQNFGESGDSSIDENSPEAKKMLKAISKAFGTDVPETDEKQEDTVNREASAVTEVISTADKL